MLIVHANLYTLEGDPVPDGYIRTAGDKILEVGCMPPPPSLDRTETVIDAKGAMALPGFVDAHSHIGMWEDGLNFEGDDGNEATDPLTPQLRAVDAVNPLDRCFAEALSGGVTTVLTGPGSANPIGGQFVALKTYGRRIDDMVVAAPAAMKMALGENPKTVYHGKERTPCTRMATAALIREQLCKAQRYRQQKLDAKFGEEKDGPAFDGKCEALVPVLEKTCKVQIHAHRADDLFTAIRIAKEFDLDYVLVHATEGFRIVEELRAERAAVIAGPLLTDRSKPELRMLTPANPGLLWSAGVEAAICTDHPVIPEQYLPLCAGLAVREGMAYDAALRAITIVPARICGIDERVGSLAPGKDADILLYESDPLSVYAKPSLVIAGGEIRERRGGFVEKA